MSDDNAPPVEAKLGSLTIKTINANMPVTSLSSNIKSMLKNLNLKAISIGFLISFVISAFGAIVIMTVIAIHTGLGSKVNGHYETSSHLLHLTESIPVRLAAIAICGAGSIIGAATTGWLVSTHRLENTLALALVQIATSVPFIPPMKNYPIWLAVIDLIITLACTLLGGLIIQFICDRKNGSSFQEVAPVEI